MIADILRVEAEVRSFTFKGKDALDEFRRLYSGKNGVITAMFEQFRTLGGPEKKEIGAPLNALKQLAQQRLQEAIDALDQQGKGFDFDPTLPGNQTFTGHLHPLTQIRDEVSGIFRDLGFSVADGPEIESEWYNFTALNFPEDHPARDMQDTFFVENDSDAVLRTHTSGVQVRSMLNSQPPIRVIAPGRVYRCDSDATHSPVFHQIEGLYVDKNVSFADLKEVLFYFVSRFFPGKTQVRFRPSYFPFTEPSAEMDIGWGKGTDFKWMEILGCGMVDPNVLENCGIDASVYTGYAFGMGIERMAMLRYGIKDIRLFYENDLRFLKQF